MARYNAVNTRAEEVAAKPFQKYGTEASDFVAQINEQQRAGINNVNAAAGAYQPYINAATGATVAGMDEANAGELDISKYMSPYIQNVADTTSAMIAQENERAQSGNLGTAISSGAFGGDRAGIAAANLSQQQNLAYGKTMADIYNQGYTQAVGTAQQQQGVNLSADQANLARLTAGGAQLAGLGTTAQQAGLAGAEAQINAGTLEQQTEQAGKTALVNQFMQEQGYPFQVAQFLANIATGTGALSGSTTATTQPAPFFSDRRLKHDVKRIGKTDDGLPIYSFKYKGDEKEQTHVGFMADEVEQVKPEAVGVHPTGYKTVDYEKATEKNSMGGGVSPQRSGEAFADGGVAGPYGSPANSQPNFGGYVPQANLPVGELIVADPAYATNAQKSMAQQLASLASLGESAQEIEGTWNWAKDKWGAEGKKEAVGGGETGRGVSAQAYGGAVGAQYLKPQQGGVAPNSEKSYLTDTLASQDKSDKPRLDAPPGGGGGGSSPAGDIAALAKVGLAIAGIPMPFRYGGAAGYADGGSPMSDEERMRRLKEMEPRAATGLLPSGRVPEADRIGAPISYPSGVAMKSDWQDAPTVNPLQYSQETGMVRDPDTKKYLYDDRRAYRNPAGGIEISQGDELSAARRDIDASQERLRQQAENVDVPAARSAYDEAAKRILERNQYANPQEILTDEYKAVQDAEAEAQRLRLFEPISGRRGYEPPMFSGAGVVGNAEGRMLSGTGLIPAAGTPFEPIRQAAGTPFYLEPRQAAGTPFPERGLIGPQPLQAAGTPFPLREAAGTPFPLRQAAGTPLPMSPLASSPRPVARPEGLGVAAVEQPVERAPTGVVAPQPKMGPVVPYGKQLDFITYELQKPEYNAYPAQKYATPGQAAIAFDEIYEKSGGQGNDIAVANAEDIYSAAQNGDLSGFPPNVQQAYQHFIDNGMDPIQASGATGRLMVESYAHMDPNARNTLGGGNGTYGIAQWRGDRMEELASFAGVPMDAITGAPISTPEGRYFPSGGVGAGASLSTRGQREPQEGGLGRGMLTPDKPYEDRTTVGKMFYNEDGTLNKNALLSLASGIGGMLSSPSQFFLPSLGLGLQGFAGTYAGLEKQAADIGLTKAQERQTQVLADKDRFIEFSNGRVLVNFGDGRPAVTLQDYLRSPQAYSTGDPQLDQRIMEAARDQAASSGITVGGSTEAPTGVRFSDSSRNIIDQQNEYVSSDVGFGAYGTNTAEAARLVQEASNLGMSAMNGKASSNELAKTVAGAIAAGDFGSLQGQTTILENILRPLNAVLTTAGIEEITPINGTITSQQILDKLGIMRAGAMTPEQQRAASVFERFVETNPTLQMTEDAAAEITSALQMSHQMDIDRAQYFNFLQSRLPAGYNPYALAEGFNREYTETLQQEKSQLSELYKMAADTTPMNNGRTRGEIVMEFMKDVNSGALDQATAQEILTGLLKQQNIDASPILARWFIRGT